MKYTYYKQYVLLAYDASIKKIKDKRLHLVFLCLSFVYLIFFDTFVCFLMSYSNKTGVQTNVSFYKRIHLCPFINETPTPGFILPPPLCYASISRA